MHSNTTEDVVTTGMPGFSLSWLSATSISISLTTSVVNLTVLIILAVYKRSRPQGTVFIISLIASDLLFPTCDFMAYTSTRKSTSETGPVDGNCGPYLFTFLLAIFASTGNVIMVTLDRYVAVTRPFRYKDILCSSRVALLIVANWVISGAVSGIGTFTRRTETRAFGCSIFRTICTNIAFFICFFLVLAFLLLLAAYCVIAKEVRSNLRRTHPAVQGRFENVNTRLDTLRKLPIIEKSGHLRQVEQDSGRLRKNSRENHTEISRNSCREIEVDATGESQSSFPPVVCGGACFLYHASIGHSPDKTRPGKDKASVSAKVSHDPCSCEGSERRYGNNQVSELRTFSPNFLIHSVNAGEEANGRPAGDETSANDRAPSKSSSAEKNGEESHSDGAAQEDHEETADNQVPTRSRLARHCRQRDFVQRNKEHFITPTRDDLVLMMKRNGAGRYQSPAKDFNENSWTPEQNLACDNERLPRSDIERLPRSDIKRLPRFDIERLPRSDIERLPRSDIERLPRSDIEQLPRSDNERLPRSDNERLPRFHRAMCMPNLQAGGDILSFQALRQRSFSFPNICHIDMAQGGTNEHSRAARTSIANIDEGVLRTSDAPLSLIPNALVPKKLLNYSRSLSSNEDLKRKTYARSAKKESSVKDGRWDCNNNHQLKQIEKTDEIFIVTYNRRLDFDPGNGAKNEKILAGNVADSNANPLTLKREYSIYDGIAERLKISIVVAKGARGNQKTIHAAVAVLSLFLLNWSPLVSCLIYRLDNDGHSVQPEIMKYLAQFFVHINAFCNPILYVARTRGFKSVLTKLKDKLMRYELV